MEILRFGRFFHDLSLEDWWIEGGMGRNGMRLAELEWVEGWNGIDLNQLPLQNLSQTFSAIKTKKSKLGIYPLSHILLNSILQFSTNLSKTSGSFFFNS